jgi:MFS family permease
MASIAQTQSSPTPVTFNTLSALRIAKFRLYFIGQTISISGTWMQTVAQGWLVFHLTQSELWLGLVACAAGLPSLLLSPLGGVIIERVPRRTLLLITQAVQMVLAFILAYLTFTDTVAVWHIMLLAFLLGVTNAIDAPTRQAIVVDLVGREHLASGIAMNSMIFNISRVIGPVVAGIVLTQIGSGWCFLLNGLSFVAVIYMLWIIRIDNAPGGTKSLAPMKQLKEGLQYARQHDTIAPLLLLAVAAALFTNNVSTLLPAFADVILHSPADAYSAITIAIGVGAVISSLVLGFAGRRFGRGRVVAAMAVLVSISTFCFGLTTSVELSMAFGVLYGFAIILQFILVNTLIQNEVPDVFRGRVMSLYTLSWFGIAPFGALLMGGIAYVIGTPAAMAIAAIAGGIMSLYVLWRWPAARRMA